jgi:hypothetical protein
MVARDSFYLRGKRIACKSQDRSLVYLGVPGRIRFTAKRHFNHEFRERQAWIVRQRDRHAVRQTNHFADRCADASLLLPSDWPTQIHAERVGALMRSRPDSKRPLNDSARCAILRAGGD